MTNTSNWHLFDYVMKIHIGEITVGNIHLTVQRKAYTLSEIVDFSGFPTLPDLSDTEDGYLLANIPIRCTTGMRWREAGGLRYCIKSYQRSYIDMTGDFEAYKAKFSGKTRSGIGRKVRRFVEQADGLDVRVYRTPQEIAQFFALARRVSAMTYQERLLDCGLPADQGYIDNSIAAAADDKIRAFLLYAKGKPVSYLYCPVEDNVLNYAYLGYDPNFAKYSPGTVLQWLAMEQLFAEQRYSAFDFTEGDSDHKRLFSTHQVPCSLQLVLRPSIANRSRILLHSTAAVGSDAIVSALDTLGLKRRVKQLLRRTA